MKLPAVLCAIPLLAGAAFAGRASDACRATPRAAPGPASLLGGFSAIAVQILWMRADQALIDLREDDAQLAFAAISELEPQLVSSGDYIARALGFTLAEDHKDPAVRWSLGREGWRVLCATVERNPGDARALAARGRYSLLRLATDPPMNAGFLRDVDPAGPLEQARRDYEEALRLRPAWLEPWQGTALASMGRGTEHLAAGRFDESGTCFRRADETFGHVLDAWRASGDARLVPSIDTTTESRQLAQALAGICSLPPGERQEEYEDLRRHVPGARLPEFPRR